MKKRDTKKKSGKYQKRDAPRGGRVKDKLAALDIRPTKERGRNFLIDPNVIHSIAAFGNAQPGDAVVEIGPGLGALTGELRKVGPLTVIEIEEKFCDELAKKYPTGLTIVNEDVRFVDFSELGSQLVVFGNIPYRFSTDIIFHLITYRSAVKRAILMTQKEFAERLAAKPGGKEYGIPTISVQLFADVRLGPIVPGTSFHPPTQVDSQLLEITMLKEPRVALPDEVFFKRVVAAAFSQRRKMIHNSIRASGLVTGELLDRAFAEAEIAPNRRAECLVMLTKFFQGGSNGSGKLGTQTRRWKICTR
jgi:16S rRNA (adenine1518-N6/adenine1519-N6)-dimethyltransferase